MTIVRIVIVVSTFLEASESIDGPNLVVVCRVGDISKFLPIIVNLYLLTAQDCFQ
jgi:hypothetical protein